MHRTKIFAVAAALVAASVAAVVLAGGASAASWHVYQGDVYAGHAYGLQVPAGAESIEFTYEGPEAGLASIGIYAPDGARVGHFALSPALTTASVANPAAGQYVLYVYEITDGALQVRVASEDEPALELTSIGLGREDIKIGTFEGKLDQVVSVELPREAVFVTLLYEGSSRGLDATVTSAKGSVVTITDESATAFSPGVWTTLKGERAFNAANLDGTSYTVEVHAEQFEGTMVLTTLALELPKAPTAVGVVPHAPPAPPAPPQVPEQKPFVETPAVFALAVGEPVAFTAPAGTLQIVDPGLLECEAEQREMPEEERECQYYSHAVVTFYAPDDTILTTIVLDHDQPVGEIALPVAGEYVAFTHSSDSEVVLAKILGASTAPQVRVLELAEETYEVEQGAFLGGESTEITLANVPLMIQLEWNGIGALAHAYLENENGMVAATDGLVVLGGSPTWFGTYQMPENFAKGLHTLFVDGVYEGSMTIVSLHYVRASEVVPEHAEAHEHGHEEHEAPEEPEAEEEEGSSFLIPLPEFPL